tara:strand:+ start:11 stop:490 length:480 start_codon:yes stop_codon:yes gene_type:complete
MFVTNVNPQDLDGVEPIELGGPIVGTVERFPFKALINTPQALVGIENFLPGSTIHWAFWHDEVQYILQGQAEITYTLVPNHNKVNKILVDKGQACLILSGTRATFKVLSEEPYTHLSVIMPRYNYDRWLLKEEYEGLSLATYIKQAAQTKADSTENKNK